jgi:hypothetical protein
VQKYFALASVQIQFGFASIASHYAPKEYVSAFRADIAVFFILNPFFGTHLPPVRNGPQYHFLTYGHGKVLNIRAGKVNALMTSVIPLLLGAVPDGALPAMHENVIGQATVATNVVYGQILTVGQLAFARDLSLVKAEKPLLEFLILVPVGDVNGANAAVKAARCYKIRIDIHISLIEIINLIRNMNA